MTEAFFEVVTRAPEVLQPTPSSASGWSSQQVRGPAVSAALARATEGLAVSALLGMRPVRWTVDLFRPAGMLPTTASATVFRQGRRIGLIDAELSQNGKPVARSRALFARPSQTPEGRVWSAEHHFEPPPPDLLSLPGEAKVYNSGRGWTANADDHLGSTRKQTWHLPIPVVEGEKPTPFQIAATVADITNLVTSWGSAGVQFINADITLAISRLPAATEVGLSALDRTVTDGIAVSTALMFDRLGQLGSATVITLANPGYRVNLNTPTRPLPD